MKDRAEKKAEVTVIVKKEGNMTQEIIVRDNGQRVQSMFDTLKRNNEREGPAFHLSSVLPQGTVIKAENMVCKRVITKDGGRITFEVNYD